MLIFGEIWKKMEVFGKNRKLSTKKRPEGRDAVHRGMLIQGLGVWGQESGVRGQELV
jgi:hypothetical protein